MSDPGKPGRGPFRVIDGGAAQGEDPAAPAPSAHPRLHVAGAPSPPAPSVPAAGEAWADDDAEAWLQARDLVGWRFALDRITALLEVLGRPHQAAPALHVVGTNGKSSVTRMIAALLLAHGRTTGAYLSPHLHAMRERIEINGEILEQARHAAAVARVARAAEQVDRPDDLVTQFEAHTAAAFVAFQDAEVDAFVVEAGLGGRLDATAVLEGSVVALTSVDLEHTQLLGDSIAEITAEKVAVVGPGATLVLGPDLHEDAVLVARDHAARIGASVVTARVEPLDRVFAATYQHANFATARAAATAFLGALDAATVRKVAAEFTMPARFERLGDAPVTMLDGAHNPAGARALVEALEQADLPTSAVAVMSVLEDKDAAGIVAALATRCSRFVLCDCGSPRARDPQSLAAIVRDVAPDVAVDVVEQPHAALAAARAAAGRDGLVVICGTLALARTLRSETAP